MTRKARKATVKPDTDFGVSVSNVLAETSTSQSDLARSMGMSTAYVNQVITGRRLPNAEWVDLVASTMKLSDETRGKLHYDAAKAHGFKLDLTKK